jgi:hypothetical protein
MTLMNLQAATQQDSGSAFSDGDYVSHSDEAEADRYLEQYGGQEFLPGFDDVTDYNDDLSAAGIGEPD